MPTCHSAEPRFDASVTSSDSPGPVHAVSTRKTTVTSDNTHGTTVFQIDFVRWPDVSRIVANANANAAASNVSVPNSVTNRTGGCSDITPTRTAGGSAPIIVATAESTTPPASPMASRRSWKPSASSTGSPPSNRIFAPFSTRLAEWNTAYGSVSQAPVASSPTMTSPSISLDSVPSVAMPTTIAPPVSIDASSEPGTTSGRAQLSSAS